MNNSLILLIARILLSAIFIMSGAFKFGDIANTAGYISSVGLPAGTALAWLAAIFEVVVGLMVLVGFRTALACYLLALFCIFTAFMFHFDPANQVEMAMMMKNLAIAGGFLALSVAGPGAMSMEGRNS